LLECPSINKYDYIVYHKGYTLSFNQVTHSSDWVAYELTKEELDGNWPRSNDFRADPDIQDYQAEYKDYKGSGWHRGHLAPAGDMKWDSVAMSESFYYTNICPQTERLNQGVWQSLENKVRKWTKQYGNLYICCGPIFTTNQNGTFGQNNVMVPDYYYKALLVSNSGTISAIAFMMKNDNENQCLENCACTIDELERVIGRDLFCSLDNSLERRIEAVIVWDDWGLTEPK
jgi:endonuclease G